MKTPLAESIFSVLRAQFRELADPALADAQWRYFKEPIQTYGLSVPQVRSIAKSFLPRLKREAGLPTPWPSASGSCRRTAWKKGWPWRL